MPVSVRPWSAWYWVLVSSSDEQSRFPDVSTARAEQLPKAEKTIDALLRYAGPSTARVPEAARPFFAKTVEPESVVNRTREPVMVALSLKPVPVSVRPWSAWYWVLVSTVAEEQTMSPEEFVVSEPQELKPPEARRRPELR